MGHALSLYAVFQVARVSVPTFTESFRGAVGRDAVDDRMRQFSARILERARVRLQVRGAERVPADGSYVYMSNHQSHVDIPVLIHTLPTRSVRMVAKTELFKVPVWGRAMRAAGMIEVDRSSRERAIASLAAARAQIDDGISVWIAPEGTRSRDGSIGKLKKGGFHLALETATPIVPVAISGTRDVLPVHVTQMRYDVPVRVTYGAPIDVHGRELASLMDEVARFYRDNV